MSLEGIPSPWVESFYLMQFNYLNFGLGMLAGAAIVLLVIWLADRHGL